MFTSGQLRNWADGEVARARGDKLKAQAAFAAARKKRDATWENKPKDEGDFAKIARLDAGLGRKEEAIHDAWRAVDLMPIAKDSYWVRTLSPAWHWFTRGRASATARSSNWKRSRRFNGRHTAISASIPAGILCVVTRASTRSSPQPRLPADTPRRSREGGFPAQKRRSF